MPDVLLTSGLIAIVLVVTALSSGAVVRSPLTFPLLFLGLGFLLGEHPERSSLTTYQESDR